MHVGHFLIQVEMTAVCLIPSWKTTDDSLKSFPIAVSWEEQSGKLQTWDYRLSLNTSVDVAKT